MKNYLTLAAVIVMALFWAYQAAHAADYSYSQYQAPPPAAYYQPPQPTLLPYQYEDEDDNIGTGCRPGCKCEFDALGKPEIDCKEE